MTIYGDEIIEKCYFDADLQTFVNIMTKDVSLEETKILLCALDNIHAAHLFYFKSKLHMYKCTRIIFDNYMAALKIIGKIFYKRILLNYIDEVIDDYEFDDAMYYLKEIMSQELKSSLFNIKPIKINSDELDEILDEGRREVVLRKKLEEM